MTYKCHKCNQDSIHMFDGFFKGLNFEYKVCKSCSQKLKTLIDNWNPEKKAEPEVKVWTEEFHHIQPFQKKILERLDKSNFSFWNNQEYKPPKFTQEEIDGAFPNYVAPSVPPLNKELHPERYMDEQGKEDILRAIKDFSK